MEFRSYEDFRDEEIIRAITDEVSRRGLSEGWSGPRETMQRLGVALSPHGITYADDMRGGWARRAVSPRDRPTPRITF